MIRRVELDEALIRSSDLLAVFFENKINLVLHKSQELRHDHFYYSMLYAYFNASKAATTGRFKLIEAALTSAEEGLKICDAHRKKRNIISRMLWSSNPNDYSDGELYVHDLTLFHMSLLTPNRRGTCRMLLCRLLQFRWRIRYPDR